MRDEELIILLLLTVVGVIFCGGICGIIALVKVVRLRRDHEHLKRAVARPVERMPIAEPGRGKEHAPAEKPATPVVTTAPPPAAPVAATKTVEAPPPLPPVTPPAEAPPAKKGFAMDEAMVMKVILWIGMTLSIIGVGFFMRYAYNNAWIGPQGRLAIGVFAGLVALGIGEHFRRKDWNLLFQIFSGGAFAVFYTCVFFSFQVYHLSGPLLSMILAILITAVAVVMAVAEGAITIAIIAVIGGFLSPVILSTGQNHPHILFIYIAILDCVALGAAYFRRWRALDLLCFLGSVAMYQGWYMRYYDDSQLGIALAYVSLFYLIFLILPVLHSMLRKIPEKIDALTLIVANAVFSFTCYYRLLYDDYRMALGFVVLGQAALVFYLFRNWTQQVGKDTRTAQSLLVVALALVLVAIPIQLRLYGIPIAWALEGTLFVYLSIRYREWASVNLICKGIGLLAFVLSAGSLLEQMPLHTVYFTPVFNIPFASWAIVSMAALLSCYLLQRSRSTAVTTLDGDEDGFLATQRWMVPGLAGVLFILGFGLLCTLFSVELSDYWEIEKVKHYRNFQANSLVVLWALIPAGLATVLMRKLPEEYMKLGIHILSTICYGIGGFVFLMALDHYRHPEGWLLFNATFLSRILFSLSLWWGASRMYKVFPDLQPPRIIAHVLEHAGHILLFILLAVEMSEWSRQTDFISSRMGTGIISAIWAAQAFALVWLGLATRQRLRRVVGLVFFGITIVKVVLYDTSQLDEVYRIVSWIGTGVLLLAAGYFYQRYTRKLSAPASALEKENES